MHLIIKFDLIQTASLIYRLEKEISIKRWNKNSLILLTKSKNKTVSLPAVTLENLIHRS